MADGFTVDTVALSQTAAGINGVISALEPLGIEETAGVGRGFSGLTLSEQQLGDAGLTGAFGDFCDRWSWGVRSLVQDGSQFAKRLGLAAGTYNMVEQQAKSAIDSLGTALTDDPHTGKPPTKASGAQGGATGLGLVP
jgi:hypothetical protein